MPVGRFMKGDGAEDAGRGFGAGTAGHNRAVMACILWDSQRNTKAVLTTDKLPMEGASKSEVVIARELAHASVEFAIVNKTTGFVDDEEREDDPVQCQIAPMSYAAGSPT